MTNQHPIVPSFEMANQWHKEACKDPYNGGKFIESKTLKYIATEAAQWGADQELEACCEWTQGYAECGDSLRLARRPKPPSLKESALESLEEIVKLTEMLVPRASVDGSRYQIIQSNRGLKLNARIEKIRKALEALPND